MTFLMERDQRTQRQVIGRDAMESGRKACRNGGVSPAHRPSQSRSGNGFYDALDLRLMDTFPASDPIARY